MSKFFQAQWILRPSATPRPLLHCSACNARRAFEASDRLRLNANGKRLDGWLIYHCSHCGRRWNRVVFERKTATDLPPHLIEAFQRNDPQLIARIAHDVDALRRQAQRIEHVGDVVLERRVTAMAPGWTVLSLEIGALLPTALRLDRLLAGELGLSRSRLQALARLGFVRTVQGAPVILKHPVAGCVTLLIERLTEAERRKVEARLVAP